MTQNIIGKEIKQNISLYFRYGAGFQNQKMHSGPPHKRSLNYDDLFK
jgi:hypothetical protein